MTRKILSAIAVTAAMLVGFGAHAQQFEAVHNINFESTSGAKAALDALFEDDAMKDAKATLYALDFGDRKSSHLIVVDSDSYEVHMKNDAARQQSHGWANYLLATQGSEYVSGDMVMVIDDHGKPRHTAAYLAAYLIHTTDAATYREAIAELNDAIGNPGVLRLVALRTGRTSVTHAVLIGGDDFAAVNKYIDELTTSDAFAAFVAKVGDTRKVVGLDMYERVGAWGY